MINIQRGTILRAFFSFHAIFVLCSGLFEPRSMHFLVTNHTGLVGVIGVALMGSLGVLSLLDVVINDILPKQYSFPAALKYRPMIFMCMAILFGAELFLAVKVLASWVMAFYCLLVITFTIITAFRDVQLRYKGQQHA